MRQKKLRTAAIRNADGPGMERGRRFSWSTVLAQTACGSRAPRDNLRANPFVGDLATDRKRSLADYAAQITLIATYFVVCLVLIEFVGLYAFLPLHSAMLIVYDARPDIGKQIFPKLWERQ